MYKHCKTGASSRRQKGFQKALVALMERQPYHTITITALCQEAEVPRKAFYRYFETKEDVFNLMVDTLMADCVAHCEMDSLGTNPVTLRRLELCYEFWLNHRDILDTAQKSDMIIYMLTRMFRFHGFFPSSFGNTMDPSQMRALFNIGGMVSILMQWYASGFQRTPGEMAELTMELLGK